jgi:diguanylate cyclase (GGDEF)-like protein
MKNNMRLLVTIGFMAALTLMFSLATVSLLQLQSSNAGMEKLVEVTRIKTAAANDMHEAIRLRSDSLKTMRLSQDLFERDAEHQRFISHSEKYKIAREQLVSLGMDKKETVLNNQLQQLTIASQPYNDSASNLLMSNAPEEETSIVMEQAFKLQGLVLGKLEELVQLEQQKIQDALTVSRRHHNSTRQLLFALTGIGLLFSLLIARAVTHHVSAKNRQLAYQASHDSLTGLINRHEFECRVERAIQNAQAQSATHTLLHLDLDQFKTINDSCGHAAGDELLQQLSQLLLGSVRHRDTLSRLGGDEFGMLFENCPLDKAVDIANSLRKSVEQFNFTWSESSFTLGISIGVMPIDRSTSDIASAMSAANSACYIAKESGRNQVQIAHLGGHRLQKHHGEMQWVSRLTRALENDQFTLYFQPIIPCANKSRHYTHLQILVRLTDDDGTVIAPGAFLHAAEKHNMVTCIDRWVIENSMAWLAETEKSGGRPTTISINLSGQTIGSPNMLKFIIDKMEETGAPAEQIIFEVTETAAVENITSATSFMLTLRGCGFRFSLDDFGIGLSSFTYLKKLPVDFLKIDGAFVRDILSDPVDYAMVRSINELGQLLGKETIADSVETTGLADELERMGVNYVQGHVFAKPRPLSSHTQHQAPRLVLVSS